MEESIFTAIDIGSELIKIISIGYDIETDRLKVIAKTVASSSGFSRGYVTNGLDLSKALSQALIKHERENKIKIEEAFFSIGGAGIKSKSFKVPHSVAHREVTDFDINKIEEKAQDVIRRKVSGCILESQPIKYIINNFEHYTAPLGMEGKKIYTDYFFLSIPKNHLRGLEQIIENNDIIPLEIMSAILPASLVATTERDRKLGCILIDLGAETTDILVYKNNVPIYIGVVPMGAKDITAEISKKEKIDFSIAEQKKKQDKLETSTRVAIDKKLKEIAQEVKKQLKDNLDNSDNISAGIIFIGGGAKTKGIQKIFRKTLSLPIKRSKQVISSYHTDYATAYGTIIAGISKEKEGSTFSLSKIFSPVKKMFWKFFKKFSI